MDLSTIATFFRRELLLREVLYLGLGIVFIFLINIFFPINLQDLPNISFLNEFSSGIIWISCAYFLARVSVEIGANVNGFCFFLLQKDKITCIKKNLNKFFVYVNSDGFSVSEEERSRRDVAEAAEEFKDSRYLRSTYDELDRKLLISYAFVGFSIVTSILAWWFGSRIQLIYFLLACFVLLINSVSLTYKFSTAGKKLAAMFERKSRS